MQHLKEENLQQKIYNRTDYKSHVKGSPNFLSTNESKA
jgi:hypothetical protein